MQLCELDYSICPPILKAQEMQGLDNAAKEGNLIKGYSLMREAAVALYQKALSMLDSRNRSIAIFVGCGNNGGDGLACARICLQNGIPCSVYSLGEPNKFQNEAKMAYDDFIAEGGRLIPIKNHDFPIAQKTLESYGLIIDAMLGIGASGELRPLFAAVAKQINKSKVNVLAADCPTGFDNKEHRPQATCIKAKETLLFGCPRFDPYYKENAAYFGKASFAPLSYGADTIKIFDKGAYLATPTLIESLLPKRDEWGDKRMQGTALVVAGSLNMTGAADLCTRAALRSGTGLATIAAPGKIIPILQGKISEPVFCPLPDNDCGYLQNQALPVLRKKANQSTAIAIGPGISTEESVVSTVIEFLKSQEKVPLVIDADGLNAIAKTQNLNADSSVEKFLCSIKAPAILTPHVREWERLFGKLPTNIENLIDVLRQKATCTGKSLILKGAPTFIATPQGQVYIAPLPNSGLAKGGSGDVLTGILVALLSQGMAAAEAAVLGVLLHQEAGRLAREKFGPYSMQPSDVIDCLPQAFLAHCR